MPRPSPAPLLDIRLLGDPILRQVATPVAAVTDDVRALVASMFATMDAAPGQGLAAPQVGRAERLCVVDVHGYRAALINPVLTHAEGRQRQEDGCLSLPGVYTTVERAARVRVEALDADGGLVALEAAGALAFCLQHEIDHLEGRLFFDYLSLLRRRAVLGAWERERGRYPDGRWHLARARREA
jgi:peptide deformylase